MKYFTKEELDTIAFRLTENPSYETLKELSLEFESKYNSLAPSAPSQPLTEAPIPNIENTISLDPPSTFEKQPQAPEVTPMSTIPVNTFSAIETPSFSIPTVETPAQNNNVNNNPINFSGNLWEPEQNKLMSTTDSFNSMPNNPQNFNTPAPSEPFFTTQTENISNPTNGLNMPNNPTASMGPSMFGQFEQNYNK